MALAHPPLDSGGASGVSQASVQPREEAKPCWAASPDSWGGGGGGAGGGGDEAPPLRPPHRVRRVTLGKLLHLSVPQPTPPQVWQVPPARGGSRTDDLYCLRVTGWDGGRREEPLHSAFLFSCREVPGLPEVLKSVTVEPRAVQRGCPKANGLRVPWVPSATP